MSGRRGVVVELCGLPGAGKSTLATSLVEVLGSAGVGLVVLDLPVSARVGQPMRGARRLAAAAGAAGRRPGSSARAARWFSAGGQSRVDAVSAWVQWLAVQQLVHDARSGPALQLLEEGLVQTLWTALLRARRPQPVDAAWRLVPPALRSDLVLLVDVPVETASTRLCQRPSAHSRTQQLGADDRRRELVHGQALLERLITECPVPVLRVASGDGRTPTQVALAAAGLLTDAVAAGSPGPR